ncbi:hypothetical protein TL16_g08182 [Triparma laevis f. inornata]|uniref:S1-like domain-containing protein n=2 Tax=Triparma laevis TaxID=1534972 RepID=A0A9W7FJH4_9STRA|nr:hypothetical protein TL16_g08182 [Triparma laevis f. inornata]GMI13627.1 hypothetical protein TrLO_g8558 [Triparma laevis f. longispina]
MSGAHRNSSYRKALQTATAPPLSSTHLLSRVSQSRGGNILEITLPSFPSQLALLPSKFKNLIWIKRNDYLIVTAASQAGGVEGLKVNYLVEHVCTKSDCVNYYKEGVWPEEFEKPREGDGGDEEEAVTKKDGIIYSQTSTNNGLSELENVGLEEGYEDEEGEFESLETDMSGLMMNTNRREIEVDVESDDSDSD